MKHSVSSGDVIIASKLASVNAGVSGIQVGQMRAGSQSIASITQSKTIIHLSILLKSLIHKSFNTLTELALAVCVVKLASACLPAYLSTPWIWTLSPSYF